MRLSSDELEACFAAMRNGGSYINGRAISDGDAEELVRKHIEWLESLLERSP